jgi:hypothetical protein
MCQKAFKIKLFPNSELFENSETQETWQCIKNRKNKTHIVKKIPVASIIQISDYHFSTIQGIVVSIILIAHY